MASTYSDRLRIELIGTGEQSGIWGNTTNTNLGTLIEEAIAGVASITMTDANYTLTVANGSTDESRQAVLVLSGTLSATRNVICPNEEKVYIVKNSTSGGQSIVIKTSAGTGITIPNGKTALVFCDGTDVLTAQDYLTSIQTSTISATSLTVDGATVINESGGNNDFRVEGDTDVNLIFGDASADSVGVGTNTPAAKLDVLANTTTDAVRITQTGTGNAFVVQDASPDTTPFVIDTSGNVAIGKTTAAVKLDVVGSAAIDGAATFNESGASVDFRVESNNNTHMLFVDGSGDSVGINISTPSTTFHVSGTTTLGGATTISGNTTASGTFTVNSGSSTSGNFRARGSSDAALIYTDTTNDRVGIGTASPGAKLNVVAATTAEAVRITQTGTGAALVVEDSANPDATPFVVAADGNVGVGTTTTTLRFNVSGDSTLDGSVVINDAGADKDFRVEGDTNANLLFADASTNRVGIGTSAPDALLTVNGVGAFGAGTALLPSIVPTGDLNTGVWFPAADTVAVSTGGTERIRLDSTAVAVAGVASFSAGAAATPSIAATGDLNTGLWFPAADTIAVSTGGAEHVRIHSTGGVSIGSTTDPGADALLVVGQISGGYRDNGTNTAAQALATYRVVKNTISANTTFTTTVATAGATAYVIIVSSGTTTRTVTFGSGFLSTGTLATGTVTAKTFVVSFVSDGTNMIETSRTVAM